MGSEFGRRLLPRVALDAWRSTREAIHVQQSAIAEEIPEVRPTTVRGHQERCQYAETERFKQVLGIERERGRWDEYKVAFNDRDSVVVKGRLLPGRQLGFVIKRGQAMAVSLFYLYAVGNEWIKVRGTVPASRWQKTDIPVFARQISAMAVSPGGAP